MKISALKPLSISKMTLSYLSGGILSFNILRIWLRGNCELSISGLLIIITWGLRKTSVPAAAKLATAAVLLPLVILTRTQVGYWRNSMTLCNAAVYSDLGSAYYLQGKYDLAIESWTKALELAQAAGQKELARKIESQLESYKKGQ